MEGISYFLKALVLMGNMHAVVFKKLLTKYEV